jgi:hypothetical protein
MRKLLNLFRSRRNRMEGDLDRELRYHLERRAEDLKKSGLSDAEARRQASIELGGVAQVQEQVRDEWLWRWLQNIYRDVRYAARGMLRNPGFAAVAIVSLALGIGANTAIFTILHALVLRSLPVSDPQRLVVVTRDEGVSSPYPLFFALRDNSHAFDGLLAFRTTACRFRDGDATERMIASLVTGGYFEVLGLTPAAGTTIAEEDDQTFVSGGPRGPVAVLSHAFWMSRYAGAPAVIGKQIRLNGHGFTVVGVGPRLVGTVTSLFGALSLALAALGLYGLLSYGAVRRTREFGIRIAIGATASSIVRLVVSEALGLLAVGTALGLGAAWALGSVVSSMLFGMGPADPLSAALAVVVLAAAALFAAWIPARRASRVEPTRALRFE